jgi:exopolysaccharide production protein ExoZ
MTGRVETIQALRFMAAGLVVLAHCASGYFLPGVAGVDIFFVISGFIITRVLGSRGAGEFALDRLTRVYPIYWLALLPLLPLAAVEPARLATSLTLWPWFGAVNMPYLVPGWTLSYELLFYAGACLVLWRKWAILPLAAVFVVCFAFSHTHPLLGYLGNPIIFEFLLGVALAKLKPSQHRAWGMLALVVGTLAIPLLADPRFGDPAWNFQPSDRALVWGVPALLIVWGGLQWEGRLSGRFWLLLVLGGEASYALYLSHPTLLLFAPTNPYLKLALMPLVCVAVSFPVHWWMEKPITRAARRLVERSIRRQEQAPA